MIIQVDPGSPVPPYEQLREQIATLAASGVLSAGARLPTVRQLSSDLAIAPGTVARAFRELENDGVVVTRGRHGTFVAAAPTLSSAERRRRLAQAAEAFAAAATRLGVSRTEALDAVAKTLG